MEDNKKEIIKVLIIASIFILIYFSLYVLDLKTGKIANLAKFVSSFVLE